MLAKSRKDYNGVITLHKPVPPHLLHHTSPRRVGQKSSSSSSSSSSALECPRVRSVTQRSTTEADKAHTLSPCSLKQLQDQFLLERWDADAIVKPLLDTEHGFIKDLEHFLNHRDILRVRKRERLHKRWTECVWRPVQQSVEQRFTRWCQDILVSTAPLKDPLFLYARSRMKEKRAALRCLTGCMDGCLWVESAEEQSRNTRVSRSQGPVYMATADGRCFRPGCWSAIGLSRDYPVKS